MLSPGSIEEQQKPLAAKEEDDGKQRRSQRTVEISGLGGRLGVGILGGRLEELGREDG